MKVKIMVHIQVNINSKMLKNVGAKYVILGHSENRKKGET